MLLIFRISYLYGGYVRVILRVVLACHQLLALRVVRFRWFPVDPTQYVRVVRAPHTLLRRSILVESFIRCLFIFNKLLHKYFAWLWHGS